MRKEKNYVPRGTTVPRAATGGIFAVELKLYNLVQILTVEHYIVNPNY